MQCAVAVLLDVNETEGDFLVDTHRTPTRKRSSSSLGSSAEKIKRPKIEDIDDIDSIYPRILYPDEKKEASLQLIQHIAFKLNKAVDCEVCYRLGMICILSSYVLTGGVVIITRT